MGKNQYIVAIEIGSSKIVGVIAQKELPEGTVSIISVQDTKISECVRYGCIKNVEEVKRGIQDVIQKLTSKAKTDAQITSIYLSLAGRSIRNEVNQVSQQLNKDTAITQNMIDRLVKKALQTDKKGFEAIDVVPQKFHIDNVEEKKPVGVFGSNITANVNTIIGKTTIRTNLKRAIDSSIKVHDFIITPLAVVKHVLSYNERQLGCMLVDMGAETTTVVICKNDAIIHLATLPFGGRNITRDIMSLNVLEDKAEELKLSVGNAMPTESSINVDGIPVKDVLKHVESRCGEIVANINEQLKIANVRPEELSEGIILIGGASYLPGMAELIEKTTTLKVKRGSYPQHVNNASKIANSSNLYIQAVSVATEAAERIDPEISCIVIAPKKDDSQNDEIKKKEEEDNKDKDTIKKPSRISQILSGFKNIFNEKDDEDEYDEDNVYDE